MLNLVWGVKRQEPWLWLWSFLGACYIYILYKRPPKWHCPCWRSLSLRKRYLTIQTRSRWITCHIDISRGTLDQCYLVGSPGWLVSSRRWSRGRVLPRGLFHSKKRQTKENKQNEQNEQSKQNNESKQTNQTKQSKTIQYNTTQHKTKQNNTKQHKTIQNKTKQNKQVLEQVPSKTHTHTHTHTHTRTHDLSPQKKTVPQARVPFLRSVGQAIADAMMRLVVRFFGQGSQTITAEASLFQLFQQFEKCDPTTSPTNKDLL